MTTSTKTATLQTPKVTFAVPVSTSLHFTCNTKDKTQKEEKGEKRWSLLKEKKKMKNDFVKENLKKPLKSNLSGA